MSINKNDKNTQQNYSNFKIKNKKITYEYKL